MKILWFGDSASVNTGFGNVAEGILDGIYKNGNHEVIQLGMNYYGDPHRKPYDIYPLRTGDPYGKNRLYSVLRKVEPDVLITNNDIWAMGWIVPVLARVRQELGKPIPWIAYFPIDGLPMRVEWVNFIRNYIDFPVTYTKWASDSIRVIDETLDVPFVYHGVDITQFYPSEDIKAQMKAQISESLGRDIKFIIGYVGRNQPRKRLPELMLAYKNFSKDKEDTLLYLHTPVVDMGWNLKRVRESLAMPKKSIMITPDLKPAIGIEEYRLANLYKMFDVLCLPTVGEGFGLPLIEGMASGCPVVSTDCSVVPEIVNDAGILVKASSYQLMPNDNELIRPIPSVEGMSEAFDVLYSNEHLYKTLSDKAVSRSKDFEGWNIDFWEDTLSKAEDFITNKDKGLVFDSDLFEEV